MAENQPKALPTKAFVAIINRQVSAALTSGKQAWGRQIATLFERQALRLRAEYGGANLWSSKATKRKPEFWEQPGFKYCYVCDQIYAPAVRKSICTGHATSNSLHEPTRTEPVVLTSQAQWLGLLRRQQVLERQV